jgi:peptidoglycan/xylan/chitin deacetylase (PgdA/CDA1 family)
MRSARAIAGNEAKGRRLAKLISVGKGPLLVLLGVVVAYGCTDEGSLSSEADEPGPSIVHDRPAPVLAPPSPTSTRLVLDGRMFPDHVLALTWDDGPDAHTLELARYLAHEKVSGTFFVVREWRKGLSSDPGYGAHVFETGYAYQPILGDLVELGHRLGNHTSDHVLLTQASATLVALELRENQRRLDPFLGNELRLFRSPGGAWSQDTAAAVDADPALQSLVGPIRWDVDRKDWENSCDCNSSRPASECDRLGPNGMLRVKPQVTARRYLASIESAGRGIVLFHDRVGHVGSRYALELAEALVPELASRGYVFAAPVLAFSPMSLRLENDGAWRDVDPATLRIVDVDGDGRGDVCAKSPEGTVCATSTTAVLDDGGAIRTVFHDAHVAADVPAPTATLAELRGDLNGDGKTDVCTPGPDGVTCAFSTGRAFTKATPWLRGASNVTRFALGDVNGDGRADLCGTTPEGVVCGMAP